MTIPKNDHPNWGRIDKRDCGHEHGICLGAEPCHSEQQSRVRALEAGMNAPACHEYTDEPFLELPIWISRKIITPDR